MLTLQNFLIILIASLVFGCQTHPHQFPSVLYVSKKFNRTEYNIIQETVSEWEDSTDGIVNVDVIYGEPSDTYGHVVYKRYSYEEDIMYLQKQADGFVRGFAFTTDFGFFVAPGPIWIVVDNILWDSRTDEDYYKLFKKIVRHELGHHFGLEHPPEGTGYNSCMYFAEISVDCITEYDLKKFCELYNCNHKLLNSSCK